MFGVSSMTARLRRVALRAPGPAMVSADASKWHYGVKFDPAKVTAIHESFAQTLRDAGCEVLQMSGDDAGIADAVFTYDASLMTPEGAILMSPGKPLRRGEQDLHRQFYEFHQIPVIGQITQGRAEAGDTLWLDDETLLIGRGFRTCAKGADQITALVAAQGITTHTFDLPVYTGQAACLHLMSLISMVDTKTALVAMPLLPVPMFELLQDKGIQIIQAPFDEFETSGTLSTNVLAIKPGQCVMLDGIPKTREALENAGISVTVFRGDALCIGCEGGPTCLTRPLLRQP